MPKEHMSDLHCHLNGSFSLEFLEKIAQKNNCLETYKELINLRTKYFSKIPIDNRKVGTQKS